MELWVIAIVFFGIGDAVTTGMGLSSGHLVEAGPIAALVIRHFGVAALVGLKIAAFGVCFTLWLLVSRPSAVGVPLGIATFGVIVTAWNGVLLLGVL